MDLLLCHFLECLYRQYFYCFVLIGIVLILNVTRKIVHKNEWIMQCSRCGTEFTIVNPDRGDKLQEKEIEKQIKAEKKAVEYKNAAQLKKECLLRNGKLVDGEKLIQDIDYFGFHKNVFSNSQGKLRITDKSLICYNDKGCFRISRDKIVAVKKKNYFLFIPTGIQIRVNDKRKKYNFVVYPKDRAEILTSISK